MFSFAEKALPSHRAVRALAQTHSPWFGRAEFQILSQIVDLAVHEAVDAHAGFI